MIKPDQLSSIGVNTWQLGTFEWQGQTRPMDAIRTSLDYGFNLFDTSPLYGEGRSEILLGKAVDELHCRDNCFIATKCGVKIDASGRLVPLTDDELRIQVQNSLDRMNLDRIDLLQLYAAGSRDCVRQQMDVLLELRDEGLTRYLGVVEGTTPLSVDVKKADFLQRPGSPIDRLRNTDYSVPDEGYCLAYDPLYSGLFTQRYAELDEKITDRKVERYHPKFSSDRIEYIKALKEIVRYLLNLREETIPLESYTLSWLTRRGDCSSVLCGIRNSEQAYKAKLGLELDLKDDEYDRLREVIAGAVERTGFPDFVHPPPLLARHCFDRNLLNKPSG